MKVINKFLEKYPNFRETFIAFISGVVVLAGDTFGIAPLSQLIIGLISGSHFIGQGVANLSPEVREQSPERKLSSKKLRFSLLFMAMTAIGSRYGLQDLTQIAIGIIATAFNVGIGISDSKTGVLGKDALILKTASAQTIPPINKATKSYDSII